MEGLLGPENKVRRYQIIGYICPDVELNTVESRIYCSILKGWRVFGQERVKNIEDIVLQHLEEFKSEIRSQTVAILIPEKKSKEERIFDQTTPAIYWQLNFRGRHTDVTHTNKPRKVADFSRIISAKKESVP